MSILSSLLHEIREEQSAIAARAPYRDIGLVGNPGASLGAIQQAEQRLGRSLPPTYCDFLRQHDGWPRFFEGATLLGTANLGHRRYEDLARATFEAAETPEPEFGPPSRFKPKILIPFGIDMQATTLFVFNPTAVDASGEYEVIAWVNEIGLRQATFTDFLLTVRQVVSAERQDLEAVQLQLGATG